mmetsp:Transcript_67457/g.160987  ORF Transcript_67457/g.160987 Transcript_67457/m.160987 type:complete len:238 (-) Transcript_67457:1281-1994(-)
MRVSERLPTSRGPKWNTRSSSMKMLRRISFGSLGGFLDTAASSKICRKSLVTIPGTQLSPESSYGCPSVSSEGSRSSTWIPIISKNCACPTASKFTVMVVFSPLGETVPLYGETVKFPNLIPEPSEVGSPSSDSRSSETTRAAAVPGLLRIALVMHTIVNANSNSPWFTISKFRVRDVSYVNAPNATPFCGRILYFENTDLTLIEMGVMKMSSLVSSSDTWHRSSVLSLKSTSSAPV